MQFKHNDEKSDNLRTHQKANTDLPSINSYIQFNIRQNKFKS